MQGSQLATRLSGTNGESLPCLARVSFTLCRYGGGDAALRVNAVVGGAALRRQYGCTSTNESRRVGFVCRTSPPFECNRVIGQLDAYSLRMLIKATGFPQPLKFVSV